MPPIIFFNSISINKPYREGIYKRLGFREGITQLTKQQKKETDRYIDDAITHMQLKGAGLRIPIQKKNDREIFLSDDVILKSGKLTIFLYPSEEIILMGATAGTEIIEEITSVIANQEVTRGVVYDATASEMVDASLTWIMDYFNRKLVSENKKVFKKRFSAGYGDFPLRNQKTIYRLLMLDKIGVKIMNSYMLVPEKSVIAITGIVSSGDKRKRTANY
jgi:hypothetical protein